MSENPDALRNLLHESDAVVQTLLRFNRDLHRDDLLAELWLLQQDLALASGRIPDPADPADRIELLDALRRGIDRAARRERRRQGHQRSADAPIGPGHDAPTLIDYLAAEPDSDPLEALQARDDIATRLLRPNEIAGTYSQPAGYALLFERVGERLRDLASLCGIGDDTLKARLAHLMDVHRVQLRLFDGACRLRDGDVAITSRRPRSTVAAARPQLQAPLWPGEGAPIPVE